MKKILWLASWYPNKLQPFTGDFIERHARSASLYNKITVLFLVKDHINIIAQKYLIEERKYNDHCSALILYYKPFSRIKAIESLFSAIRYFIFLAELIRRYILDNGKPDLLHVHVGWRAGLLALYCRWKYQLRYVVSEHWSVFIPDAIPSYYEKHFIIRQLISRIYKNAFRCSAVSNQLATAISLAFKIDKPVIIPNVVDTSLFRPSGNKNEIFRFIHISEFNYQKNPGQIFEAVALLKQIAGRPFEVLVFAPDPVKVNDLALKYEVREIIKFMNYVPQDMLALEINHSDALILYSRFETFGCVVIEAMASGIPVIVSDIAVMHEIVKENVTGIITPLNQPSLLAEKMLWMMNNKNQFSALSLAAQAADAYSFEKIGRLFNEFYKA